MTAYLMLGDYLKYLDMHVLILARKRAENKSRSGVWICRFMATQIRMYMVLCVL